MSSLLTLLPRARLNFMSSLCRGRGYNARIKWETRIRISCVIAPGIQCRGKNSVSYVDLLVKFLYLRVLDTLIVQIRKDC